MDATPVSVAEDRSLQVPAGAIVRTGYVSIDRISHASRERMTPEGVERAYRRRLSLGSSQPWPPPVGQWAEDGRFVVYDGRHEHLASWMLGYSEILVAWVEGE